MTVKELIDKLQDCRSDADVMMSVYDNSSSMSKVIGVVNKGNYVSLYELMGFHTFFDEAKKEGA